MIFLSINGGVVAALQKQRDISLGEVRTFQKKLKEAGDDTQAILKQMVWSQSAIEAATRADVLQEIAEAITSLIKVTNASGETRDHIQVAAEQVAMLVENGCTGLSNSSLVTKGVSDQYRLRVLAELHRSLRVALDVDGER